MTVWWVALGAAVGAPLRFLVSRLLDRGRTRLSQALPWGTLVANVTGSLVLGWLAGAGADPVPTAMLGTGLCGALTTFSTFSYESWQLIEAGAVGRAALNVGANLLLGFAAVSLGLALGGG